MKNLRNTGTIDRAIRVVLGIVLFVVGATGAVPDTLSFLAYVLAAVMLATGVTGVCPLYRLIGVDTRRASPGRPAS